MKTKPPTQIELATLAANLPTGTASERVTLAFEIWQASADPSKVALQFWTARLEKIEAAGKKPLATMLLQDALAEIMPETPTALRLDRWKRFRQWQRDAGSLDPWFEDDEKIGISISFHLFGEVKEWEIAEKSLTAKTKATLAAKTRWNKTPESKRREGLAGGKTQQVKKRAKS
jgi:hypothetical protein